MRHDLSTTKQEEGISSDATHDRTAGTVVYAVIGTVSVAAVIDLVWVGVGRLLDGNLQEALGVLVFLPMAVTGASGAYERFVRGAESRMFFHLALQLPICLLLHFLSRLI